MLGIVARKVNGTRVIAMLFLIGARETVDQAKGSPIHIFHSSIRIGMGLSLFPNLLFRRKWLLLLHFVVDRCAPRRCRRWSPQLRKRPSALDPQDEPNPQHGSNARAPHEPPV